MVDLKPFLTRVADIHNVEMALAVLNWDQRTFMPAKGAEARAKQLATLAKISHEMSTGKETLDLLASAEAQRPAGENERAMLRVARRNIDKAAKVPTALVVKMTETCALAEEEWQRARAADDYAMFAPWLEKVLELKRQYAKAVAPEKSLYNALLDDYEEGMTTEVLDPLFENLKKETVPLVAAIGKHAERVSDEVLTRDYEEAGQEKFGRSIMQACGFSFERGRLDVSVHPFCTNFAQNDVRITTRYERNWLPGSLFGCMHEMGHAFYEMNVDPAFEGTPLAGGVSMGVHESQSRLWENMVGRSREFWEKYYPELQKVFPQVFKGVSLEDFYKAINKVGASLIRVEADEVTYNLHIILRYEMEQELIEKMISVAEAPAAWNAKMKSYLGITPPTNREGILQDVHWSGGGIGYFPTYTLGNILAAQLFETAEKALPGLRGDVRNGKFSNLYEWLRVNVHQHGHKYPPTELIQRATGRALTIEPYVAYLKKKFSGIYGL